MGEDQKFVDEATIRLFKGATGTAAAPMPQHEREMLNDGLQLLALTLRAVLDIRDSLAVLAKAKKAEMGYLMDTKP